MFCQKYDRKRVTRKDWGCLVGLADVWPDGFQTAIFKTVLDDLKAFIVGVREADPESKFYRRYYEFLPIKLLRKYPLIAVELHIIKVQATGAAPLEWLKEPMKLLNKSSAEFKSLAQARKGKTSGTSSPQIPPLLQQVPY